jgi:hypothetical protein
MVIRAPHTKRLRKGSTVREPCDSYGRKTRKCTIKSKKKTTRIPLKYKKPLK